MITLTKDLEVGVAAIDNQHRELINRLNKTVDLGVASVTKEETERTLDFLGEYIVKHFRDEEKLQIQCGYPKYEWHKGQHNGFIAEFEKLKLEYQTNGTSAKYTLALNNSIIQWIVRHIKSADSELGKYYLSHS